MPPIAPTLISPISGISRFTYVTFEWSTVPTATAYWVMWSKDPTFATYFYEEVTTTTYTSPLGHAMGLWYWKVRAWDGTSWGPDSTVETFNVSYHPLVLLSPLSGSYFGQPNPPTLEAQSIYGDSSDNLYQFQLDTDNTFPSPTVVNSTTNTLLWTSPLARGTYYWRFRHTVDGGVTWSPFSEEYSFRVSLLPPDNLDVLSGPDYFKAVWSPVTESGVGGYILEWAPSSAASFATLDVGSQVFGKAEDLRPGASYFVRVRAYDDSPQALPGQASNVEQVLIMDYPILRLYQDAERETVEFTWELKPQHDTYTLEIDSDTSFGTSNLLQYTIDPVALGQYVVGYKQVVFPGPRRDEQLWYYRLRGHKVYGEEGLWSNQNVDLLTLDGYKPSYIFQDVTLVPSASRGAEVLITSSIRVSKADGSADYVINSDYELVGDNQIRRKVGSSIADGEDVIVYGEYEQHLRIAPDVRRESRERMNDSLDRLVYDKSSRTTGIYNILDMYAKEFGPIKNSILQYGQLKSLLEIDKYDLQDVFANLVGVVGVMGFPWISHVINGLNAAFQIGGTKQGVRIGVQALTGIPPDIYQLTTGWVIYSETNPPTVPLPGDYYVGPYDVSVPLGYGEIIVLAAEDLPLDFFIEVFNVYIPFRTRVDRSGNAAEFLGKTLVVEGTVELRDSSDNVISPTTYSVDGTTGMVTFTGAGPSGYFSASFYCSIEELVKDIVRKLLPVYVRPIFLFRGSLPPLVPSSDWGIALWGPDTWGGSGV